MAISSKWDGSMPNSRLHRFRKIAVAISRECKSYVTMTRRLVPSWSVNTRAKMSLIFPSCLSGVITVLAVPAFISIALAVIGDKMGRKKINPEIVRQSNGRQPPATILRNHDEGCGPVFCAFAVIPSPWVVVSLAS